MPEATIFNGVDGVTPPDKVAQDEAAAASNVDFSLYPGAAAIRRGTVRVVSLGTSAVEHIFRHYSSGGSYGSSPWYAADSAGVIHRVTGGFGGASAASAATGGVTDENDVTAFAAWRDTAFIASGTVGIRDNGTATRNWVPEAPSGALALTTSTATPVTVVSTFTMTEGTAGLTTWVGTATATTDEDTLRIVLDQAPTSTDLSTNGANAIGDYGVHSVAIALSEPRNLRRVLMEYSIGDATYENKLTAQLKAGNTIVESLPDPDALIEGSPIRSRQGAIIRSEVRREYRPSVSQSGAETASFTTWSVPTPDLAFSGRADAANFADIVSCRLILECDAEVVATVKNWVIQGDEAHPLNDLYSGLTYWETFARVETVGGASAIVDESAPSPASAATKIINGAMIVASTNTATDTTLTHRVIYRQGGYLRDAYAVSTHAIATATITDTLNDIDAAAGNWVLTRDVRTTIPQAIRAAAVYSDRMFVGYDNRLAWSLPGRPGAFPRSSETTVSHAADRVQALHVFGDNIVIVNRDSVYEMVGNVFEDSQDESSDWVLKRTNAKGGSVAARAAIRTPHGVLLAREEGLFMYQPGVGIDRPIDWIMDKVGDIFRGNGAYDPAQQKGSRVGAGMDQSGLSHCVAAWHNDMLWFGFPSGTSATRPNLFFVADFVRKRVSFASFPWNVRSMWSDRDSNALLMGTTDGAIMRLQINHQDLTSAGSASPIVWNLVSREWVVDGEITSQSARVLSEGQTNGVFYAVYDGTNTATLGTLGANARAWEQFAMDGSGAAAVQFKLAGTQASADQGVIHRIEWDGLFDPPYVTFLADDDFDAGWQCEKIWDGLTAEMQVSGTGTVTAVTRIDGTAVQTSTVVGPFDRTLVHWSLPCKTFGDIAVTTYTAAAAGVKFRLWPGGDRYPKTRYMTRQEPCRVNDYRTTVDSEEERLFDALDVDIDPNGTVSSVVELDGTAIGTYTFTGTLGRQSFPVALPEDSYGRTISVCHSGTLFKHYKSWFHSRPEPDRLARWQYGPRTYDSEQLFRTVVAELNPLGTATAVVRINGTAVETATLTGTRRNTFEIGLDINGTGGRYGREIEVDYYASALLKHYDTQVETSPKPFGKDTWIVDYTKIGGADRLDLAVAQSMDVEVAGGGTGVVTSVWDVDGWAYATNTLTFVGRQYLDRQLLPPGMRGHIFRQILTANVPVQVWSSRLELQPVGVKGGIHRALNGTPR